MVCVVVLVPVGGRPAAWVSARAAGDRVAAGAALGCFAVLCVMALSFAPRLVEPDDYAYRASIVAMTQGDFLTLSTAQADALAAQLPGPVGPGGGGGGGRVVGGQGAGTLAGGPGVIPQW